MTDSPGAPDVLLRTYGHSGAEQIAADVLRITGIEVPITLDVATPGGDAVELYVVRDPIDALWHQYLAEGVPGQSFDDFLLGPTTPIDAWAHHLRELHEHRPLIPVIKWELYLADPLLQVGRVVTSLGHRHPRPLDWLQPRPAPDPSTLGEWGREPLIRLREVAGELLLALGYDRLRTMATHRRRARRAIRYVSRDNNTGYGVAGRRCVEAMLAAGLDIVWEPDPGHPEAHRDNPSSHAPAALLERYEPWEPCDLAVLHTMPEKWGLLRERIGAVTCIGHTVWELDRLPKVWDGALDAADRIWVPTEWNRRTFTEGGITRPVDVIPHVVTNERADTPPIDLPTGTTVFTTVSTWHPRKRPDWTVEAFARAFTGDDPVLLVVKTPAITECWPTDSDLERMTWWQLMQVLKRHKNPPRVVLVNDHWTDEEINGLITRSACYVSLPASEGWGLGLFDAATFGVPVITTGYGGHLEFLGDDHPGLVPHGWTTIGHTEGSAHLEPDMVWAQPDLDAAARMMRSVLDRGNPIAAAAEPLAARLRTTYSPDAVGATAVRLLEPLL